jgi:hypothetical protein
VDTELTTLMAQSRGWQQLQRWPGACLLGVGLWSLVFADPWGFALVAVGFWGTAEFWRGVRVTGDTFYAQGRISRRTLPLDRIRQVGIGSARTLWVQPVSGRTLVLPMAETRVDKPGSVEDVHDRLRELAEQAGADLAPAEAERRHPPRPATLFFGW